MTCDVTRDWVYAHNVVRFLFCYFELDLHLLTRTYVCCLPLALITIIISSISLFFFFFPFYFYSYFIDNNNDNAVERKLSFHLYGCSFVFLLSRLSFSASVDDVFLFSVWFVVSTGFCSVYGVSRFLRANIWSSFVVVCE